MTTVKTCSCGWKFATNDKKETYCNACLTRLFSKPKEEDDNIKEWMDNV